MTTELMAQSRITSTTTCLMWTQSWSMWTRTSRPTEDSWVPYVWLFYGVSLVSSLFDALHITLWLKCLEFVPHSFQSHRHVSCAHWVTLSSTSPSTSLIICPAFLSALHLEESRQQPCALPLRSRVPRTPPQKLYDILWNGGEIRESLHGMDHEAWCQLYKLLFQRVGDLTEQRQSSLTFWKQNLTQLQKWSIVDYIAVPFNLETMSAVARDCFAQNFTDHWLVLTHAAL